MQGVGLDEGNAPVRGLGLADAHHLVGEVSADDAGMGVLAQGLRALCARGREGIGVADQKKGGPEKRVGVG